MFFSVVLIFIWRKSCRGIVKKWNFLIKRSCMNILISLNETFRHKSYHQPLKKLIRLKSKLRIGFLKNPRSWNNSSQRIIITSISNKSNRMKIVKMQKTNSRIIYRILLINYQKLALLLAPQSSSRIKLIYQRIV